MSVSEKKPINRQFERVSAEDVRRAAEYQAAILADVPCTASGVVRRNPDAKWLRREEDIASFAAGWQQTDANQ